MHITDNYLVYADCIEDQFYGDSSAKVIRNLVPRGSHGEKFNIVYDSFHYIDLN